jgi:hypothetical protein
LRERARVRGVFPLTFSQKFIYLLPYREQKNKYAMRQKPKGNPFHSFALKLNELKGKPQTKLRPRKTPEK